MQLTAKTTQTFIRRLASASLDELEDIRVGMRVTNSDTGQLPEVREVARGVGIIVRAQIRQRE